jgi:hypothetical protein
MGNMDSWDVTLLVVAGYLAIVTLVRLMARYRNQVIERYNRQAQAEIQLQARSGQGRHRQSA